MPALLLALLFTLGCAHAQDNLVANPGFETAGDDGQTPAGWTMPTLPGVEFAWDDQIAHSGARSARVTGTDPDAQSTFVQAWRQNVSKLPGGRVWISSWVKADSVKGRIGVLHRDENGQVLRNQMIADVSGTYDWREFGASLEPEPGTVDLQLVMGLVKSTGSLWFDDVSVTAFAGAGTMFGTLSISPDTPGIAGQTAPVEFTVRIGEKGLRPGGAIKLRFEAWRPAREFRLAGFRADTGNPAHAFEITIPPPKSTWPPTPQPVAAIITLIEGTALKAGDTVTIRADLTYTAFTNVIAELGGLLSPDPNSADFPLEGTFRLTSTGGEAKQVLCTAEARPIEGAAGRVTVAVTDAHGNPCEAFRGTVSLRCSTGAAMPEPYAFTEADRGSHEFRVTVPANQVSRITASCGEMKAISNPILPRKPEEPGIYFGDIHSHCEISADAVGDPDLAYEYARRFFGMDFAGLSDHSPRGKHWQRNTGVTNRHNADGQFVTFLGFEWSDGRRGHRNAYYRGDSGPEQPNDLPDNMESWWARYDETGDRVLTVPHHPNTDSGVRLDNGELVWGPVDWSAINHKYQRIVEICQLRGAFEVPGPDPELRAKRPDAGASVQTALAKGHRLGFIGSTDTHSGRPGNGDARAAIVSAEFTRAGLWDAMHDRSCYATTGPHMLIFFRVNGRPMGSEIALDAADTPRIIDWRVVGTGPVKRVDLVRNNEVVQSWQGGSADDLSGEFTRAEALTGTEWWYLRVIQEDTHLGWSSPVWVDPPGSTSAQ